MPPVPHKSLWCWSLAADPVPTADLSLRPLFPLTLIMTHAGKKRHRCNIIQTFQTFLSAVSETYQFHSGLEKELQYGVRRVFCQHPVCSLWPHKQAAFFRNTADLQFKFMERLNQRSPHSNNFNNLLSCDFRFIL